MALSQRLTKRVDSLEWRMDAMDKLQKEIVAKLDPMYNSIQGLVNLSKLVGAIVVLFGGLEMALHWFHH